jgi:beta-aspartyl-peptidase (threonine type)
LARLIMERTDHVMMAGNGAEHLARLLHLETRNPVTRGAKESWRILKAQMQRGRVEHLPNTYRLLQEVPDLVSGGTVGAVALDSDGGVAAATSSGGLALKLPGRIGDTPLIGCGTYADSTGGCSVTGIGEGAIRLVLAKTTCDFMQSGATAQQAVQKSARLLQTQLGMRIGLIAIDSRGRVGSAHSTRDLCWAFMKSGMSSPMAALKS